MSRQAETEPHAPRWTRVCGDRRSVERYERRQRASRLNQMREVIPQLHTGGENVVRSLVTDGTGTSTRVQQISQVTTV